jgi:predicted Zn-dependent peptidase
VKRLMRSNFIRGLTSNEGLAGQLAVYQGMMGDWRLLFREMERMEAITPQDIRDAAKESLRRDNSVVGMIRKPAGS